MDIRFDHLSDSSRIWIYQGDRKLSPEERSEILQKTETFVRNWSAHGSDLLAGGQILHDQFIVLSVDEDKAGASGCSIDKSVHFIQSLEHEYGVSLLDRSKVAFYRDGGVVLHPLSEIKMKIDEGLITPDTLIFNNLVDRKGDLEHKWLIPARDSWLHKYFNAV